jgi:hypothetical protein
MSVQAIQKREVFTGLLTDDEKAVLKRLIDRDGNERAHAIYHKRPRPMVTYIIDDNFTTCFINMGQKGFFIGTAKRNNTDPKRDQVGKTIALIRATTAKLVKL